jgi:hypothetical protein
LLFAVAWLMDRFKPVAEKSARGQVSGLAKVETPERAPKGTASTPTQIFQAEGTD